MPDEIGFFKVRPLRAEDVSRLAEIDAVSNIPSWTRGMFERELELPISLSAVAVHNEIPVAFGIAWTVGDTAQLHQIAVSENYRRNGVGRLILKDLFESARRRGCGKMELELRKGNEPARFLYEKMGFKINGERKGFYEKVGSLQSEDAVLMSCELK